MSSLRSVEAKLPPGFRFHPRDEELLCDYLMKQVTGCPAHPLLLPVVDLHKCEPWDLPDIACVGGKEWYFYTQRDRKYATGQRTNRATLSGYWKATGKDRPVNREGNQVGMRKTLVFYEGRAPKGRKTDWVMHEYRLEGTLGPNPRALSLVKEDWVVCRVFFKNAAEISNKSQESGKGYEMTPSSPTLPPLMEPYNNDSIALNEHVPFFSIVSTNQTSPIFSPVTHMGPPKGLPSPIGHLETYDNSSPSIVNNYPSPMCDEKVMQAVLRQLAKMDGVKESPSFKEGSTNSYLFEEVLSPIWSQFS